VSNHDNSAKNEKIHHEDDNDNDVGPAGDTNTITHWTKYCNAATEGKLVHCFMIELRDYTIRHGSVDFMAPERTTDLYN